MNEYKLVFSDIDGTLLNSSYQIDRNTLMSIKELQNNGVVFVLVSARNPLGIYPIMNKYALRCPIIAFSGALILDEEGNILFNKGIPKENIDEIIDFIEREHFDLSWCIYAQDEWIVKNKSDPRIVREETIVEAQSKQGSIADIENDEINKILCICNSTFILDIERKLKQKFPEYSIVKSSDILIEIMEKGITKASGIEYFCKRCGVDLQQTIAFGDNYNDVEMLESVGLGVLMGNAPEALKLKMAATMVTDDNNHNGIYHALKKVGLVG